MVHRHDVRDAIEGQNRCEPGGTADQTHGVRQRIAMWAGRHDLDAAFESGKTGHDFQNGMPAGCKPAGGGLLHDPLGAWGADQGYRLDALPQNDHGEVARGGLKHRQDLPQWHDDLSTWAREYGELRERAQGKGPHRLLLHRLDRLAIVDVHAVPKDLGGVHDPGNR